MTSRGMVRQVAKILSLRTRLGRPPSLPNIVDTPSLRNRKFIFDFLELHRNNLRRQLERLQRTLQQTQCQYQLDHVSSTYSSHSTTYHSTEIDSDRLHFRNGKGSISSHLRAGRNRWNEALEDAFRDNKLHESFLERKKNLREALRNRKALVNYSLNQHKEEVRNELIARRKVLEESLQARRDKLTGAEKKMRERGRLIMEDLRETKNIMKGRMEEVVEKENIYTIPNLLCVTRIVFSPYLGYLIINGNFEYALGFMVVASISDFLDGWIARNFKSQSTKIGSFLDPMADKVLIGTLFLTLTYVDLIPVPLTALIVGRDVALVVAGFVIRYKSLPPPRTLARYFDATHATAQLAPTLISKVNTAIQLALVGSTLAAPVFGYVGHPALQALCYVTGVSTILAAASYITTKDTYKYLGRK